MTDKLFLASYLLLWVLFLLTTLLLVGVLREVALLRNQVGPEPGALAVKDGPKIGAVAPVLFGTVVPHGDWIEVPTSEPALVAFLSPDCQPCLRLLPELQALSRRQQGKGVYGIVMGRSEDIESLVAQYETSFPIFGDTKRELASRFDVHTTPFVIALDNEWVVRSKGIANNREHLEALLRYEVTFPRGLVIGPA